MCSPSRLPSKSKIWHLASQITGSLNIWTVLFLPSNYGLCEFLCTSVTAKSLFWGWLKESPCNLSVLRIQMLVFHVSNWLIFIFGHCELDDWPESVEPNLRPSPGKSYCNLCFRSHPGPILCPHPCLFLLWLHLTSFSLYPMFYIFFKPALCSSERRLGINSK